MELSQQLNALATVPQKKEPPPVAIEYKAAWAVNMGSMCLTLLPLAAVNM